MPTAHDLGAVGYERQGEITRILSEMLSGITSQGSTYFRDYLWEAVRSFYLGWKWAMDALTDGFQASAYDPAMSSRVATSLAGVATNSSDYFGAGGEGGRSYLSAAAIEALRTGEAYNQAASGWANGVTQLLQKAAEVYSLFWQNSP